MKSKHYSSSLFGLVLLLLGSFSSALIEFEMNGNMQKCVYEDMSEKVQVNTTKELFSYQMA